MTIVSLIGILLSLAAFPFAFVNRTPARMGVFMLALAVHAAAAFVYYRTAQATSSDTSLYYFDYYELYREKLRFGTMFVIHFDRFLRDAVGGSYLDHFMIFQAFGFWGIALLMRIFEEIYLELDVPQPRLTYLMLFLPGLQFWTSSIGKDGPLFFAIALAIWAVIRLRTRFIALGVGIFVMLLFRPHIALLALVALSGATIFDPRTKLYAKLILLALAAVGLVVVAGTIETSMRVNVASAESIGDFFSRETSVQKTMGGGTSVIGAPYPIKLLSLLFRPFFFDADGAFGLIASMENVFILYIIVLMFRNFRTTMRVAGRVFFLRFAGIFAITLMLLLSFLYYNVGLGLRQKMMLMPGLLAYFAAIIAVRQADRSRAAPSYA